MIITAAVGISLMVTSSSHTMTERSQDVAICQAAADGAIEYAYGIWKAEVAQNYKAIDSSVCSNITLPSAVTALFPSGMTCTVSVEPADEYGVPTAPDPSNDNKKSSKAMMVDVIGYPGWRGRGFNYVATAVASIPQRQGRAISFSLKRVFTYTEVPLFQTMFFFEHDIELYRSNTIDIGGLTHTNRWGFISSDADTPVTFSGNISHVLGYTNTTLPYRIETWRSGYTGTGATRDYEEPELAAGVQVTQVARLEPFGQDPATLLDATPTAPLSPSGQYIGPDGNASGDTNLNNDSMHELIEPPQANGTNGQASVDPPAIAKRRIYGKAGLVISVNNGSVTITAQNGTGISSAQRTTITNAITVKTGKDSQGRTIPNYMYDKREGANVHITNVNVGAMKTALEGLSSFNGVLYIDDTTTPTSSVPKNGIRLYNGGNLPNNGLTIATEDGIYVHGDYNTGATATVSNQSTFELSLSGSVPSNGSGGNANNDKSTTTSNYTRKPAALIGDAVTVLSNGWIDTAAGSGLSSRKADNTTINAAFLTGFVPSGYTPTGDLDDQYGYSGGANNYPRFLEDWGSRYFTYVGSMVELFVSKTFTGAWDTGDIYAPPLRAWKYDTNFDSVSPPGSLDAIATTRGPWIRF